MGATIASVLAELVITIIYFRMAKDYLSFKNITKRTYQYIIAAIFMGGTILLMLFNMKMSALTTVIEIIAGITIYFTILLMFKNDLVIEGLNIIKKKFNRNKLSTKIE